MAGASAGPQHFVLELDMALERGGVVQVLFDYGDGFYGENAAQAAVPPGKVPQTVRLPLPTRPIRALRLDPTSDDQSILISGLRLLDDRGQVLLSVDPAGLRPRNHIQSITRENGGVRVQPVPRADDPQLRFDFAPLQKQMHDAAGRATVGRASVTWLALLIVTMMTLAVLAAARALATTGTLAGSGALFLAVLGARLLLLNLYSRPVPYWDEWEGDALYILVPFTGGFLDWEALVMPQWEHRILLTRVITLFGALVNGEWDPRVAMTVSAVMFSAMIALIGTALLSTRHVMGVVAAVSLGVAASLPYDFNNLLWGGQTQMYGLLLLAGCTLALAATPRVTTLTLAGAAAGGLLSLFTMGAGPVAPGCAAGICLARCWFEPGARRGLVSLAAIFFAVALLGVFLHVTSRQHVPLYARTVAQFLRAFIGVLAWPLPPRVPWALLVWLPWCITGVLILRRRGASTLEWLGLGLGGWGLINASAIGYARQYEGPPFDSRFLTAFSVGAIGSLCCWVALALRASTWPWRVLPWLAGGAVAAALIGNGARAIPLARESSAARAEMDQRIRLYFSTGNHGPLVEKPPAAAGDLVVERLDSPLLQQILPAPYRRVLAARGGPAAGSPIEAGGLTLAVRTLMKTGFAIALAGLGALAWWLWRERAALRGSLAHGRRVASCAR